MADKLYEYVGCLGRLHGLRDDLKEKWTSWKASRGEWNFKGFFEGKNESLSSHTENEDYLHIYRKKTRLELIRISAAVMGIEFSYAAETAFVSPTLLKIGVEHKHMTLVWALSPLIGFFVTPVLGSLSDRCHLAFGRRRPFILLMSIGVLLGLLLVPNGETIGYILGDVKDTNDTIPAVILPHRISSRTLEDTSEIYTNETISVNGDITPTANYHPWGILFTILGTVLLDFDADACQSPARAYLLDVTISDDHARGLSTFTIMAGLGGFFGYGLGGINWDETFIGNMLGGHVKAVFTLITIIFIVCVICTLTSFKEIPLEILEQKVTVEESFEFASNATENKSIDVQSTSSYGSVGEANKKKHPFDLSKRSESESKEIRRQRTMSITPAPNASLLMYLKSIIFMPNSIRVVCLTNLFSWMAHVCYSLYFTDFVGEAVFNGSPTAPLDSPERSLYEEGIRFGCWGMSMYSLSCALYSLIIEKLITKFGARKIYVLGLLTDCLGMCLMALIKHKIGVILFSATAGVMYSTLFTMPYLLIAHYHSMGIFDVSADGVAKSGGQIRGLGTDVAIISSMVFLAQFLLSLGMGYIVALSQTTTAVVVVASILAFCGALTATQIMYLDL